MRAAWIGLLSLLVDGCTTQECVSNGERPGILLIDAKTQAPVCGAIVALRAGSYEETAVASGGGFDAFCDGIQRFSGRDGSYVASVTAPNYVSAEEHVTIRSLECSYEVEGDGPHDGLPGFAKLVTVPLNPEGQ